MKFDDNLKNSTETVKAIFHLLCKEIEMMDVRGYPTNNGDYRFVRKDKGKGLIFCELIPKVRLKINSS